MWWLVFVLLVLCLGAWMAYQRRYDAYATERAEKMSLRSQLNDINWELTTVKKRRKRLLSASTQALIVVEANNTISRTNKVARRLFGKPIKRVTTITAWIGEPSLHVLVDRALSGVTAPPLYFEWQGHYLEAHARSIRRGRRVIAAALAIHDVSDLQRLGRARRDFVANISRELRTPVVAIEALTHDLMAGGLDDPTIAYGMVDKIVAQTDTLRQLAQEMMDLSLIESGQKLLKFAPCSLWALVEEQVIQMTPQFEREHLTLTVDIPQDIIVLVDRNVVSRVFTNLIHNAIKFTATGGVTITAHHKPPSPDLEGDWVVVSITDTGQGIPQADLERVFERFYKVEMVSAHPDNTRLAERQGGTGLGLTIAKYIVEAHGGRIWAESNGQHGSTFQFTLPVD